MDNILWIASLVLVNILCGVQSQDFCPELPDCYCYNTGDDVRSECLDTELWYIPDDFPLNTTDIVMGRSKMDILLSSNLSLYSELRLFHLTENDLLTEIEVGAFDGLDHLEVLKLDYNKLTKIELATFAGLIKLTQLYLNNNLLTAMPPLNDLTSLMVVDLKRNVITSMPANAFGNNPNMLTIDLSYNSISSADQVAFSSLEKLESLYLDENRLANLVDGLFNGLVNLKYLSVNNNLLTELTNGTFSGTGANLELLQLSNNRLVNIANDAFVPLTKLTIIYLENNHFTVVPSAAIKKIQSLKEIYLNGNLMTEIQDYSFSDMPLLDAINIGNMDSLVNIALNALSGTMALTQLSIYGNTNLNELTLAHLPDAEHDALAKLKIYDNGFTVLKEELFASKPSLELVDLFGNPFHCDCALNWMPRVMEEDVIWAKHWTQSSAILCESPVHLTAVDIRSMKELDLTCLAPQMELWSPEIVVAYLHGNASLQVLAHNGMPNTWWVTPSGEIYYAYKTPPPELPFTIIAYQGYLPTDSENVVISIMEFSNVTQQDAGTYTVHASNHIDNVTIVINLEVLPYELTPVPLSTTPITSTAAPSGVQVINYVFTIGVLIWMKLS